MKNAKHPSQQQLDHHADTLNDNKGTSGTNITNAKMQGNRGKLMNPNQLGKTGIGKSGSSATKARNK